MEFELFLGNSHDYSYLGAKYYMKRKKYTWDDGTSQLNKTAPDSCVAFLSSAHIDNVTLVQFLWSDIECNRPNTYFICKGMCDSQHPAQSPF